MSRGVYVHLLPTLFEPDELRGGAAVMIDVLRASTTIVHALAAGATAVVPCEEVDEARRLAANHSAGECLLGGEREGVAIDGFNLDNSPLAYTADVVEGKTIYFTTTNGTRALLRSRLAERILIGAFVNLQAILDALAEETRAVHLVCAGTRGEITAEDTLFAGALAVGLQQRWERMEAQNDATRLAVKYFCSRAGDAARAIDDDRLYAAILDSAGGRNLLPAGFEADIRRAAEVNLFDIAPVYDPQENVIRNSVR